MPVAGLSVWGRVNFQIEAGTEGGHILSHQGLEFSDALGGPGASVGLCGAATRELIAGDRPRTGS